MRFFKKAIKFLDLIVLKGMVTLARDYWFTSEFMRSSKGSSISNCIQMNYTTRENELAVLCHKFGSDKGAAPNTLGRHHLQRQVHNYADLYSLLFGNSRSKVRNIFECGIGTNNEEIVSNMGSLGKPGASLRVWKEYFPKAKIIGADIDPKCLFEEERIRTFQLDQTDSKAISKLLQTLNVESFDLIFDDGLHTFEAGKILFENLIAKLALDGTYIIEDVNPQDTRKFQDYFKDSEYSVFFVHLVRKGTSIGDNSVIIINKR